MIYHPIKFGCKQIICSADMVETVTSDQMSPHFDPKTWRQQTNLLAWHIGPWCCITIPSLVAEGSAAEEISFRWTFTGILNIFYDLDHDHNTIQSFYKKIHLMMVCHKTKFSCKRISSSGNIIKGHILLILFLTVILTLKTANQSFWKTIWLIMMHHQIKFGSKRFRFRKYHLDKHSLTFWHFAVTLTLSATIQFLNKTLWLMIMYFQTKFGSKRTSSSKIQ